MKSITIKLNNDPVASYHKDEIEKRLLYLDYRIHMFKINVLGEQILSIAFETDDTMSFEELQSKTLLCLDTEFRQCPQKKEKPLWKSQHTSFNFHNVMNSLESSGDIHQQSHGQYTIGGLFLRLFEYFDNVILEQIIKKLNAIEYRYPTLIPSNILEKCGCFNNFPHLVFFVTHLHNDINNYDQFHESYASGFLPENLLQKYCVNHDYCLPPTMCYHTYHQFSGETIHTDEPKVITSRGKSFRYESRYAKGMERLFDFTIRETVFMGSAAFAISSRERFLNEMLSFIDSLKLEATLISANDLFFRSDDTSTKIAFQQELESKYELHVRVSEDSTISVGSFNIHMDFFGKNFNIRQDDDKPVHTACTGIGLERFTYAFLCQHGLDPSKWPITFSF